MSSLTRQLKVSQTQSQAATVGAVSSLQLPQQPHNQQLQPPSGGAMSLGISARKFSDNTLTRALSNLSSTAEQLSSDTDVLNRSQSLQNILNQSHSFRKFPPPSSGGNLGASMSASSSVSSQLTLHNTINANNDPKDEVLRRWLSEKERREQLEKRNRDMFRELRTLRETVRNYELKGGQNND